MLAACPPREVLASWSAGLSTEPSGGEISEHVYECGACLSSLDTLGETPDPVLDELRRPGRPDPLCDEPACGRLVARVSTVAENRGGGPAEGSRLGPYEIRAKIGSGGMGAVYRARHVLLNRDVALKLLPVRGLGDAPAVERFLREIKSAGALDHPNVVQARDAGVDRGVHYLVMELVDGLDLTRLVKRRGPLAVADACEIVRQAAEGLEHLARRGLVHRDVKPSNLMLTKEGAVKLLDLGLGLLRDGEPTECGLTSVGQLMGTPDFMAPEQAADPHSVDIRADLYGLGGTLYFLLSGCPPFPSSGSGGARETIKAHARETAQPIRERRPEVPKGLAAVLDRLLAKRPVDRYATPAELAKALAPFARGSRLAGLADAGDRPEPQPAGNRRRIAAGAAVAAALLGGAFVLGQLVIHVRDKDGRETKIEVADGATITVEKGGKVLAAVPAPAFPRPIPAPAGESLSPVAIVSRPAKLPGVRSWTIETRGARGGSENSCGAAFSPDGRRLAVGGLDGTIRLLDGGSGRLESAFIGHAGTVSALAFSPDGKALASGGADRTVRVWEAATGRTLAVLRGHSEPVTAVAYSPDGKTLASGSMYLVKLRDAESFDETGSIPTPASALAWSPDGKSLATGGALKVRVWEVGTLGLAKTLSGDVQTVLALAWSPDGKTLAAGGNLGKRGLDLFDVASGELLRTQPNIPSNVHGMAFSPDGKALATVGGKFWDLATGRLSRDLEFGSSRVAWSTDGRRIAFTDGCAVAIAEADPASRVVRLEGYESQGGEWVCDGLSPDGSRVASPILNGVVTWEPASAKVLYQTIRPDLGVVAFAWSPDGGKGALSTQRDIWTIDAADGSRLSEFSTPPYSRLCWSPDGKTIATFSYDEKTAVRLWDGATGTLLKTLEGSATSVYTAAWSPDASLLACGETGNCRVWDVKSGKVRSLIEGATAALAWSPDGKILALVVGRQIRLYETPAFQNPRVLAPYPAAADGYDVLAWSPDGRTLALSSYGPASHFWDVPSGQLLRTVPKPAGAPGGFSRDLRSLVTYRRLLTVVSETQTGRALVTRLALSNGRNLFISPDGHYKGPRGVERELVYVIETDRGQETLAPDEFATRFGWKNDPAGSGPDVDAAGGARSPTSLRVGMRSSHADGLASRAAREGLKDHVEGARPSSENCSKYAEHERGRSR